MKLTFLGSGTSQGIPVIGCDCSACLSQNVRDKRLRSSVYIEVDNTCILIDIGPDFRQQMLTHGLDRVDFLLLTHEHNDHTAGLDDIRPLNYKSEKALDVYAQPRVCRDLKQRFSYIFAQNKYPGLPQVNLIEIGSNEAFRVQNILIQPIRILHGRLPILGYRIGKMAYLTDVLEIPEDQFGLLKDLDVLILSSLRKEKHFSHLSLRESIEMAQKIGAKKTYLMHMSHLMGPVDDWKTDLPPNIKAAYDGLVLTV